MIPDCDCFSLIPTSSAPSSAKVKYVYSVAFQAPRVAPVLARIFDMIKLDAWNRKQRA